MKVKIYKDMILHVPQLIENLFGTSLPKLILPDIQFHSVKCNGSSNVMPSTRIYKRREPSCLDSPGRMRWPKDSPLLFFRPLSFHVSIKNVTAGKSEKEKKKFSSFCVTLCGWFSSCFWFAIKRGTRSLSFYAPCPLCRIEFPPWRHRMPIQVHTIYKENKSFFIKIVLLYTFYRQSASLVRDGIISGVEDF